MTGIIILTSLGLILSILIVIVDSKLGKSNHKVDEILKMLPGYNCNACGYNGCKGMAEALLKDPKAYLKCRPMTKETKKVMEDYFKD